MHRPRYDDADKGRADQRTDYWTHVQSDIVVARAKIDKVAGANGDDASYGHHPEQPARILKIIENPTADMAAATANSK